MFEENRTQILAFLARPGMNKVALADLADLHPNTLQGIDRDGDWKPSQRTVQKLLAVVAKHEPNPIGR